MIELRIPASCGNLGAGLDALGLAIDLPLQVKADVADTWEIDVLGDDAGRIPVGPGSILRRSYARGCAEAGVAPPALRLQMESSAPVGAGLGSSGAAAVAGLLLARELAGASIPPDRLLDLAVELEGPPDNAASILLGGFTAAAVLAGGRVRVMRIEPPEGWSVVAAVPEGGPWPRLRRPELPESVALEDAVRNLQRTALLTAAFAAGRGDLVAPGLADSLHVERRASLVPGLREALAISLPEGILGITLSGAGPSLVAIAEGNPDHAAAALRSALPVSAPYFRLLPAAIDRKGARVIPSDGYWETTRL